MDTSDEETEYTAKPQTAPRKRGRPRKNAVQNMISKQSQHKKVDYDKKSHNEEIILQIPLYGDDDDIQVSDKNVFTMRDDSDDNQLIPKLSLSDDIRSIASNDSDEETLKNKVKYMVNELKKKDALIKKLKTSRADIDTARYVDTSICTSKDMKNKIINLKLINSKNSKPVVVDTTNIACWWCTESFNTIPCFLPDRYCDGIYYVFGCFCTYSCVKAYNSGMQDQYVMVRIALINKLCNEIFGENAVVPIAPPREMHQKFGGPLSTQQFRDSTYLCKKEFKLNLPPMIPLVEMYDEMSKDIAYSKKNNKSITSKDVKNINNKDELTMGHSLGVSNTTFKPINKSNSDLSKNIKNESGSDSSSDSSSESESERNEKPDKKSANKKVVAKKINPKNTNKNIKGKIKIET